MKSPKIFWSNWNFSMSLITSPELIKFSRSHPGECFELEFIPNQSECVCRNLCPNKSELFLINPKKVFYLVWWKIDIRIAKLIRIKFSKRKWLKLIENKYFDQSSCNIIQAIIQKFIIIKKNLLASLAHSHRALRAPTYMNFALRVQCCVLHSA